MENEAKHQSNALRIFTKQSMRKLKTPNMHNSIEPRSSKAAEESKRSAPRCAEKSAICDPKSAI
jgi:hypothetical protein